MINTNEVLKALYNVLDSQNKQDNNARLLSLEEILDCNEDLQVEFSSVGFYCRNIYGNSRKQLAAGYGISGVDHQHKCQISWWCIC